VRIRRTLPGTKGVREREVIKMVEGARAKRKEQGGVCWGCFRGELVKKSLVGGKSPRKVINRVWGGNRRIHILRKGNL